MDHQQEDEVAKESSKIFKYRKILGLLGAILIFFPEHIVNYWGNMSVYIASYIFVKHGDPSGESPWALGAFSIGRNFGMNVPGYLTCVSRRTVLLVAILIFNMGVLSLYLIVQNGLTLALFFLFGILGLCSGVMDSTIFKILSELSSSSRGLYMSAACSAFNFGPFMLNLFVGFYVNPYNTAPSLMVDDMALFDDKKMLDKTLSMIIILAVISSVWMLSGLGLISLSIRSFPRSNKQTSNYGSISRDGHNAQSVSSDQDKIKTSSMKKESDTNYLLHETDDTISIETTLENGVDASKNTPENSNAGDAREFTPLQTARCPYFYVIWFSYGACLFGYILLNQYYKSFGLIYIDDDNLLTDLGSGISLVQGFCRIFWGLILDRFRTKTIQIIVCSYLSISILAMYFVAAVNKYVYCVITLLAGFGVSTKLPTYLIVCLTYFGKTHFNKNYGLLCTSSMIFAIIIPLVFDALRSHFGMFGVFCCTSSVIAFALVLTVTVVPDIQQ